METCRSPWTVMRLACAAAREVLPDHASRFSRHDFTLAQLFACLVLQQVLGLSYRRTEAVLRDTDWCQRLGACAACRTTRRSAARRPTTS